MRAHALIAVLGRVALVAVVGACATSTPTVAPSSPAATEAPMPSPLPSPSPASSGTTDLPTGEVAAGTYRGPGFEPPITLTVGDGWYGTTQDGFFDVQQRRGTPEAVAVQVADVEGVVGPDGNVVLPRDATDAARTVAANPGLTVLGESDSRLGGLRGRVIEVRNQSGHHAGILDVPPGRLGIDDARALWIAFLDTPDGDVLAVIVGGPSDGWEAALTIAEPVLESVVFGG